MHPPQTARVQQVLVTAGQHVARGAPLAVLESKGRNEELTAPRSGVVVHVGAMKGTSLVPADAPFVLARSDRKLLHVDGSSVPGAAWIAEIGGEEHPVRPLVHAADHTIVGLPAHVDPAPDTVVSLRPDPPRCSPAG